MCNDLLFKKACKLLLSMLFIFLIFRIDKSPFDTLPATGTAHTSQEVSFLEKPTQTFDTQLFLIPLYFEPFPAQTFKHQATISSAYPNLIDTETVATIFCKYTYHNRSNQVLTKVLLI